MRPRIVDTLDATFRTDIFGWIIPTPAVMYAAAMIAVLLVFVRRSGKDGISAYHALGAAFWAIAGGLVGARIFYLLLTLDRTLSDPLRILNLGGGSASWGAYLGGASGLILYCYRYRRNLPRYADMAASCLGLGVAIGRWSCFLNGDDYGTLSNLPWAVRFPHASYPFVAQVQADLLDPMSDLSLPVHPVQLYLSLNGLILFFAVSYWWKKFHYVVGSTFCFYWFAYGATRFLWEFTRGDRTDHFLGTLTIGQVVCIAIVMAAGTGWKISSQARKRRGIVSCKG